MITSIRHAEMISGNGNSLHRIKICVVGSEKPYPAFISLVSFLKKSSDQNKS